LGNSVEEVRMVQWFKKEGEPVQEGETLGEVETDKTNMEFPSPVTGVVRKLLVSVNDYVPVEANIAIIGALDEDISALLTPHSPSHNPLDNAVLFQPLTTPIAPIAVVTSVPTPVAVPPVDVASPPALIGMPVLSPRALRLAAEKGLATSEFTEPGSGPGGRIVEKDVLALYAAKQAGESLSSGLPGSIPLIAPIVVPSNTNSTGSKISPLAQAIATDAGIDVGQVAGSGTGGRILAEDVRPVTVAPIASQKAPAVATALGQTRTLTGIRKRVADNLSKSVREKPHVTLHTRADMVNANKLRADLLPVIEKSTGVRLSPTDIVMKACAVALTEFPLVNAHIEGDTMTLFESVHIGLAVSLGDEGLIVPVIRDVEKQGFASIAASRHDVASRARSGKLLPTELSGGTFTITNLGNYGIEAFNPIIPPPQVAILGVCSIQDEVVALNGVPTVRPRMGLSLSFDHRAIDGAPAAAFLARVKEIIENPAVLLA
jgi:pyruvate dehydrogenase E2 component (dihydrolipoamide acetyltransferase)